MAKAAPTASYPEPRFDEEALRKAMLSYQQGDRIAASEFVRSLTPMLYRFFAGPRLAPGEADDMLQDCWLRIHRARHSYRPPAPVLPWVFAIARHSRLDAWRRRRRTQSREVLMDPLPERPAPAAQPADENNFYRLLESLPSSQREVLLMMKVSGMSIEEVARATGSTAGAVKQKAHRAYEKLRHLLQPSTT